LRALDVGPGDLVAVPAHTFIATWLAVKKVGATPLGIDCDENGLIDLDMLAKTSQNFKAVIPVHMHGQPVNMPKLMKWAKSKNIMVIEDCAQSHGALINSQPVGSFGDVSAFSFYPTKNLPCLGDGGALATNDTELAKRIRSISNYGYTPGKKYQFDRFGVNSRLDPIQASILSVNLKYLEIWNSQREKIAQKYSYSVKEKNIKILNNSSGRVWHHFCILTQSRARVQSILKDFGIETLIHYPENASISYSKITGTAQKKFLVAERISRHTLSLPLSPWLSEESVDLICKLIREHSEITPMVNDLE
jgi:dTDP-4-amino-4,6-dideoxygalactose transaminase